MFEHIEKDVEDALSALQAPENLNAWNALELAWKRTVVGTPSEGGRLLMPFIGSGMNRLSGGGVASWANLVQAIREAVPAQWTDHDLESARLSLPEELELLLTRALEHGYTMGQVHDAFRRIFKPHVRPSDVHGRLVRLFSRLVTTNYDRSLELAAEAADTGHVELDLTLPEMQPGRAYLEPHAILHLHGIWHDSTTKDPVFWGVGKHPAVDHGGVIVLTEHQYHRLYNRRPQFQRIVHRLFSDENLLLFMGTSLSRDEFGIHSYLRDLQMAGGQELVGIHIGPHTNGPVRQLLLARGIVAIHLPSLYGFGADVQCAVWHAVLNVLERRFGAPPRPTAKSVTIHGPEIVCVGLSARQTILALSRPPQEEGSCWIPEDSLVEESGGQHLVPAVALARRGHRVALITRLGPDTDGDQILRDLPNLLGTGDLDLQTLPLLRSGDRRTRHTYVVTYRNERGQGVRTCYDWEDAPTSDQGTWHDRLNELALLNLKKVLDRYDGELVALYLGASSVQISGLVIERFGHVRYRFLETSTTGCADEQWAAFQDQALACTHVLASAKFIYRLLAPTHKIADVPLSGVEYQARLAKEIYLLRDAHTALFRGAADRQLVVVLGSAGAAYLGSGDREPTYVPTDAPPPGSQLAWIGCGDLFRGTLISELLHGRTMADAVTSANRVAADRTRRVAIFDFPAKGARR